MELIEYKKTIQRSKKNIAYLYGKNWRLKKANKKGVEIHNVIKIESPTQGSVGDSIFKFFIYIDK